MKIFFVQFFCAHLFHNFPQFIVIHTVKGFGIVNKAEIDVSLKLSCFVDDPADVGNLIPGSSSFDYAKAFDCVDLNKLWKILQEMGTPDLPSWETCMQVRKQQLELDMEQKTGSK